MTATTTLPPSTIGSQACALAQLSFPVIVTALIQEACLVSTLIFVGRLKNAEYMGAATLGNMICNVTGFSLAYGMCSVLDTLISQAYGAKKYRLMGVYSQRAITILTLACLPVLAIWNQSEFILHYILAIPRKEAQLAGLWSRILCLGLWPSVVFEILRKFLQGQNIVWPVVVATLCGTIFNVVCNYVLMYHYNWGFEGPAFTVPLTNWFSLLVLVTVILVRKIYIRETQHRQRNPKITTSQFDSNVQYSPLDQSQHGISMTDFTSQGSERDVESDSLVFARAENRNSQTPEIETDPEDNWPPLSPVIFEDWYQFLSLGVPGALSLFIEWGSYEMAASIAGQLGSVPLAAHGIFMSTAGIFYMTPQAVALSASTLVGNYLGAKQFGDAKAMVTLSTIIDFGYGTLAGSLLLFVLRSYWGPMFSDNQEVQDIVYHTMPIMFLYCVLDSTKCITLNILRSTGRPQITVVVNTVVCLIFLLPLGYYLAIIKGFGLIGIWGGMSAAWGVATVIYFVIVLRTDWEKQVIVSA